MPLDPRYKAAADLALALAVIYNPGLASGITKGTVALNALMAALELFREAEGRPADWVPTAADWDAFIAERQEKARREPTA